MVRLFIQAEVMNSIDGGSESLQGAVKCSVLSKLSKPIRLLQEEIEIHRKNGEQKVVLAFIGIRAKQLNDVWMRKTT
jgi:hypothetical protein